MPLEGPSDFWTTETCPKKNKAALFSEPQKNSRGETGAGGKSFFDVTRARSCQSVYLQHSYGTDGNTERFVRALYGRVCNEAVRHENHADLKPLSWPQKQLRDPDNYGISCMLWTWQQLPVRKNCGIVRRSRLSACALPWWVRLEQYRRRRLKQSLRRQ